MIAQLRRYVRALRGHRRSIWIGLASAGVMVVSAYLALFGSPWRLSAETFYGAAFALWLVAWGGALWTTLYHRRTRRWVQRGGWRRLGRLTRRMKVEAGRWSSPLRGGSPLDAPQIDELDSALADALEGVYASPHAPSEVT